MLNLTKHAVDRYREQHSGVPYGDILAVIESGTRESADLIRALTMRHSMNPTDKFIMPLDKQGVFVIADNESVVTYLRFGQTQQDILQKKPGMDPQPIPVAIPTVVPPESAYRLVPVLGVILGNVRVNESIKPLFPDLPALHHLLFSATEVRDFGNEEREILVGDKHLIAIPSKSKAVMHLYSLSEGLNVLKQRSVSRAQKLWHKEADRMAALHERYAPVSKVPEK